MSNQPSNIGGKPSSLLERLSQAAGGSSVAGAVAKTATSDIKTIKVESTGGHRVQRPTTDVLVQSRRSEDSREVVKPKKTSADQVLFVCKHRPNFGTALPSGTRIKFQHGFLLTNDKDTIAYLRANLTHFALEEDKGVTNQQQTAK